MKKRIIAVIVILAVLVALFFIGTGFQKRMDVVLVDYSVSEDGTEITLDVGIPTSTGYIRGFKDNGSGFIVEFLKFIEYILLSNPTLFALKNAKKVRNTTNTP